MSFKICVIGCGAMATKGHGPSYVKYKKEHPDTVLAGCCDLNSEAAQAFREKFGFENAYTDYNIMLDTEKPDVVCIITNEKFTKEISVSVLKKGFPVLLEKPPGMDREEGTEISNTARQMGIPARVAFNRRYMPLILALKGELKNNQNPIINIDYTLMRVRRRDNDFSTTAIHAIDAVKYIAESEYGEVNFCYNPTDYDSRIVSNTNISCRFVSGATSNIIILPAGGCVIERAVVTLKDYTYFLNLPVWNGLDTPGSLICTHKGDVIKHISGSELCDSDEIYITNGFYNENAMFFDQLKSGKKIKDDIYSAIQSVEIAEFMRKGKKQYINK